MELFRECRPMVLRAVIGIYPYVSRRSSPSTEIIHHLPTLCKQGFFVELIATMIEPFDGTLYDPCCGSGGMFIQSVELVKAKKGDTRRINVYGQEKEAATHRLAKMNLVLRNISHHLGETRTLGRL